MEERLREILKDASNAPSAHNYQPWAFRINEKTVFIIPETKVINGIYGFEEHGNYISFGALVENIEIAANHHGFQAIIKYFPNDTEIASIFFQEDNTARVSERAKLYGLIKQRATNRKSYESTEISSETIKDLLRYPDEIDFADIRIVNDKERVNTITKSWATSDWLLFNNEMVHKIVFPHIVWETSAESIQKGGLFIDTMQLPPPVRFLFKFLTSWRLASLLGKIGFGSLVAKQNCDLYKSSGVVAGLVVSECSPTKSMRAGRLLQNFWLKSTEHGIGLHIIVGELYLYGNIKRGKGINYFTESELSKIIHSGDLLMDEFGVADDEQLVLTFRLGYAKNPNERSPKRAPIIKV